MTKGNVLRLMDERDLFDVPDARKEFEQHGHHGSYFFFVIMDYDQENIIGYLIAKKNGEQVLIETFSIEEEKKEEYRSTVLSNLNKYVREIKDCAGTRMFRQVTFG